MRERVYPNSSSSKQRKMFKLPPLFSWCFAWTAWAKESTAIFLELPSSFHIACSDYQVNTIPFHHDIAAYAIAARCPQHCGTMKHTQKQKKQIPKISNKRKKTPHSSGVQLLGEVTNMTANVSPAPCWKLLAAPPSSILRRKCVSWYTDLLRSNLLDASVVWLLNSNATSTLNVPK